MMMILGLVRNYIPSYQTVVSGGWNIADCVSRSYDLEGMTVGTVASGRIGLAVLRRLHPFEVKLAYVDRHRLPASVEEELNLTYYGDGERASVKEMVKHCDVVTLNCPLHPGTEHMFDADMISGMKRGAYIVNTARGKLTVREDIAAALESGQLAGYAGDVWFPQPPPKDHPWRTMPWHAMTPHTSGTSLSAQSRYCEVRRQLSAASLRPAAASALARSLARDATPSTFHLVVLLLDSLSSCCFHSLTHSLTRSLSLLVTCATGRARDAGVLVRRQAHPRRVPHHAGRQAGGRGRALVQ